MKKYLLFNLSVFASMMALIATLFYVSSGDEYLWAFLTAIWAGLVAESEYQKINN